MAQSLATLEAVTKEIYSKSLRKQLNDATPILKRFKSSSADIVSEVGGKYVTFPIHTRRNTGIGARNEMEALPQAGRQGAARAKLGLRYLYGALELTGQSIRLVDKDYQSFISAVEWEVNRVKNDLAIDLNRQIFGDGTGALARVAVGAGPTNNITVNDVNLAQLGMLVDVVNVTTGDPLVAGRTINNFDADTNVITLSGGPITVTTDHVITRAGNWEREWLGLDSLIGTGILHDIDPATEPVWKSHIDDNGGSARSVSEGRFNQMSDRIKIAGGKVTALYTTYGVQRSYLNLLQQQRHYVNAEGKFDGGWKAVAYNTPDGEVPIIVDHMAPRGRAFFVNEGNITLYRDADWEFMDYDGKKWQPVYRDGGRFDAYESHLFQYSNLGTDRRNTHGVINDLEES